MAMQWVHDKTVYFRYVANTIRVMRTKAACVDACAPSLSPSDPTVVGEIIPRNGCEYMSCGIQNMDGGKLMRDDIKHDGVKRVLYSFNISWHAVNTFQVIPMGF